MCELLWTTLAQCLLLIYMVAHEVESIIVKICSSEVVCWFESSSGDVILQRQWTLL